MSKALTWWKLFQLSGREIGKNKSHIWMFLVRQCQKNGSWIGCLLAIVLMWLWNWKLLLATAVGIGGMLLIFWAQNCGWQQYWARWRRFLTGFNSKLIVAVGSGSIGAFSTYLAACTWTDLENHWLAVGSILQGFGSLTTILLLIWSVVETKERHRENRWEKLQTDLTHSEPLKRLIAIRQLTRLLQSKSFPQEYSWQCSEYFRLMLSQPQVPMVRQALVDSLEQLEIKKVSLQELKSLQLPLRLEKKYSKQLW